MKKKTPRFPGAFWLSQYRLNARCSGSDGSVDHLRSRRARVDRNAARLLGFGNLADEIDVEQAVLERGVLHLHEVGELEGALERTGGDAAVEHFRLVLAVLVGGF